VPLRIGITREIANEATAGRPYLVLCNFVANLCGIALRNFREKSFLLQLVHQARIEELLRLGGLACGICGALLLAPTK